MIRIYRGLVHLYNGTLLDRLRREWHQHVERRRQYTECKRIAWWESQVGRQEHFETRIQRGVRMRLYFDSQLSKLIHCKDFEWKEQEFLNVFLRPGDVFVDVGANIGLFTLIAARCVGHTGHVYAFEPCSETYHRLVENVQLNQFPNVSAYQLALSDHLDQLEMTTSLDGFDAWNSLAQPSAGKSFATETIDCTIWDDFARKNNLAGRVTMMKIDVEGWESHVLSGGSRALSRADAPILQVEFTEQNAQSAGSSCEELYHLLEKLGYQMFIYDAKLNRLVPDPIREDYPYLNLIAVKQPEQIIARLENRTHLHWLR